MNFKPDDAEAITSLLRELGSYQLEGHRSLTHSDITVKDDTSYGYSVVTEYDEETERRVFAFIEERFPEHSFLGEEHGNVRRDTDRYWILDPIDGTSNFTQGVPFWGPSLAYVEKGSIARGWIYFPVLDQMFTASRGEGAFLNGRRLKTSGVREYSNLCTVGTVSRLHRRHRLTCPAKHRILGSIVVNLAYLAQGSFAAIYCRGNIWDLAAGLLIAEEAGAVVDANPPLADLDLPSIDPGGRNSISVWAMANAQLPSLRAYIETLEDPIEGK